MVRTFRRAERIRKRLSKQLRLELFRWTWQFSDILEKTCHKKLYQTPTRMDQLRLLNIKAWSIKYMVPVEFIVKTLVDYWSSRVEKRTRKKSLSIGCKIPTFVGKVSEQVLKDTITKTFRNNEHIEEWKSKNQELYLMMLKAENYDEYEEKKKEKKSLSIKHLVEDYGNMIDDERKEIEKLISSGVLTRRRYRNNPWI